jgi:hypothetical protein
MCSSFRLSSLVGKGGDREDRRALKKVERSVDKNSESCIMGGSLRGKRDCLRRACWGLASGLKKGFDRLIWTGIIVQLSETKVSKLFNKSIEIICVGTCDGLLSRTKKQSVIRNLSKR